MNTQSRCRPATTGDSRFIAGMIDLSSDGIALIEWTESADEAHGETAMDVGARLYAREDGDYSYRNAYIAEIAKQPVGMLLSFPMPARDADDVVQSPPFDGSDVFAPYKYLEAPDTWYICGVAVMSEFRGCGIGTDLMQIAGSQAREHGYGQLSLVVFAGNTVAVRLYRKLGFETVKRAPVIPHPLIRCSGDALLMVAPASVV